MAIEEMKAKVEFMKAEIARIDKLLDDEFLTDEEYDRLEKKAASLTFEHGMLQKKINKLSVKNLVRVSDWEASFLSSFLAAPGRLPISKRKFSRDSITVNRLSITGGVLTALVRTIALDSVR